jgi:transcription antitermination protein NusB
MVSGRRAAREVALLVLFAVDIGRQASTEEALVAFRDHLRTDRDVLNELVSVTTGETPPAGVLNQTRKVLATDSAHWQFVERLVQGVESHSKAIDDLIERFSLNWKVTRMGRVDRNILRVAVYELAFEGDVPTRATLNEAIEIAKRFGSVDSGKFVNGILDRLAQELGRV